MARKSVSLSALAVLVLREPHVRPPTIVKYAHASILFREMAILHVLNVRQKFVDFFEKGSKFNSLKFATILAVKAEEPECRVDGDCPSKHACINKICQNPCLIANPCSNSQVCQVTDTHPTKSVACLCPDRYVVGPNGDCKAGK